MRRLLLASLALALAGAAYARDKKRTRLDPEKRKPESSPKADAGTEWKGQHGGRPTPGHDLITDAKAWRELWMKIGLPTPETPDFRRSVAVIIYLGDKPTGGYSVEFLKPAFESDRLVVRYRLVEPGGMATQAFTQPWRMRLLPKPKGDVVVRQIK